MYDILTLPGYYVDMDNTTGRMNSAVFYFNKFSAIITKEFNNQAPVDQFTTTRSYAPGPQPINLTC